VVDWDLDLLGDPIPPNMGRRGRPPHLPTIENRRKVMVLAAFDRNEDQIAAALSISVPTLKKHYFRELRQRLEARQRLDAKVLMALVDQIEKGNVAAMAQYFKRADKHDLALLAAGAAERVAAHPRVQVKGKPKPGKKESKIAAAKDVAGRYAPPPGPRLIN